MKSLLWELLSLSLDLDLDLAFFYLFLFLCLATYPLAKIIIRIMQPKTTTVDVVIMVWFVIR